MQELRSAVPLCFVTLELEEHLDWEENVWNSHKVGYQAKKIRLLRYIDRWPIKGDWSEPHFNFGSTFPAVRMSAVAKKLEKYLDPTQQPQKKYKSIVALFKEALRSEEEYREAVQLKSAEIISFFKESIKYLEENQKRMHFPFDFFIWKSLSKSFFITCFSKL